MELKIASELYVKQDGLQLPHGVEVMIALDGSGCYNERGMEAQLEALQNGLSIMALEALLKALQNFKVTQNFSIFLFPNRLLSNLFGHCLQLLPLAFQLGLS